MSIRIFFSSDVHGATAVWQKWIKATEMYNINVMMFCGDLTGKVLVPLIKFTKHYYKAYYFGKEWTFEKESEIKEFERRLEDIGAYFIRVTMEEVEELKSKPDKIERIIVKKTVERLDKWLRMLTLSINTSKIKTIVMPGNDDNFEIDEIILQYESSGIIYPLNKIVKLDDIEIISLAHVNPTPWNTPREVDESILQKMIKKLIYKVKNPRKSIFNFHSPPYGTRLDLAPQIGKNKKPIIVGGQIKLIHVGSKAVRKAIERYQPLLGLHGHIHESPGVEKIGKTLIMNPGSEYSELVLRGFIIEISDKGELNYWRIEG